MQNRTALAQLQRLSQPFVILLTVALALGVLIQGAFIVLLFFFHGTGTWHAAVSFSGSGINLAIFANPQQSTDVALDSLALGQRAALALLTLLCAACAGLVLFHLRQLFALYSRGVVFSAGNVRHIKWFGAALVLAAIVVNLSGRMFFVITGQHPHGTTNAVMALIYGAMTFVIARVMELGREADEERKEFV